MITVSKEDYLKAIHEAESEGESVISATLAHWLKVSPPAVTMALRRLKKDGATYFGPYFPGNLAHRLVNFIHRHFLVPSCKVDLNRFHPKPCLQYHIHRCLGPCVEGLTTPDAYAAAARQVRLFLEGRHAALATDLRARMEAASADNKKQGDAYLAENGKKEGVVVLPSGLQYKVITAGKGRKPAETDTVMCNYKGTFTDGTEFDSSPEGGKPVPFEIKSVIPGFKEALQLMPVGSKWQIVVPPGLGYGDHGAGNVIGPNATLIFEVELVSIQGVSVDVK